MLEHGIDSASGFTKQSQQKRFDVFIKRCVRNYDVKRPPKLLDYGCGVGDLFAYLEKKLRTFEYLGVDINPTFVNRFNRTNQNAWARTVVGNIFINENYEQIGNLGFFDYVVASGAFCYADQQYAHPEMFLRLWSLTSECLMINFLNDNVPLEQRPQKPIHCFYHPSYAHVLAGRLQCQSYSVFADYLPNDWTIALYRNFR